MSSPSSDECDVLIIAGEDRKLDSKDDVRSILQQIEDCQNLNTLKLSGNSFGIEAAEAIGEKLAEKPTLQRALWSDMFVSRVKTEIPPALTSLGDGLITAGARLVELDLSDNAFGPAGVTAIRSLLTSSVCYSLRVLKLNNNGLGIGGGKILAGALLECHEEATKEGHKFALEVFQSGRNRLEDEGATALAQVFQTLGSLVEVSMPQNGIYHEGISALAEAFGQNHRMEVINLCDNTFAAEGSVSMANALPSLQQIRVLNFGDCLVRNEGARAIAKVIREGLPLLEDLSLGHCEISTDAAIEVVNSLGTKNQLKNLNLNGNQFGEQGIESITQLLEGLGREELIGSFSDDEGEEDEEEEEEKETRTEADQENASGQDEKLPIKEISVSHEEKQSSHRTEKEKLEDWLAKPTADTLLALGETPSTILRNYLGEDPTTAATAELYVKVAASFSDTSAPAYRDAVHDFIDVCMRPFCDAGSTTALVSDILVQVGLIKSEDKSFKPVKEARGPLLALVYLVKQPYFPRPCRDILIAFITKGSPVLDPLNDVRHQLLSVLHS